MAAASPSAHLNATLPGATSCTFGAPEAVALSVAVTDGSGSQATWTFSAPSWAADWLSAMTTATGSPTCRATSEVSGMCGTIARSCTTPGMPFSLRRSQPHGSELTPVMSLPVNTATTPGCALACADVDALDPRVRVRAAHERRVGHAGQLHVVDVLARGP